MRIFEIPDGEICNVTVGRVLEGPGNTEGRDHLLAIKATMELEATDQYLQRDGDVLRRGFLWRGGDDPGGTVVKDGIWLEDDEDAGPILSKSWPVRVGDEQLGRDSK